MEMRIACVAWTFTAIVFAILAIAKHNFVVDDAYISARYATNLVSGKGWVYNPGEAVNAATSPAFVLLLAALALVFGAVPNPALVCIACIGLSAIVAGYALGHSAKWRPAIYALVTVCMELQWSVLGMEAPLQVLAILLTGVCLARACNESDKLATGTWVGAFAAISAGVRPEGILLLPAAVATLLVAKRRRAVAGALASYALFCLCWIAFVHYYVHSLVPSSLGAKLAQASVGIWSTATHDLFAVQAIKTVAGWPCALVLAVLGARYALRDLHDSGRAARTAGITLLLLLAFGVVQAVGYSLLNPARYGWYFAPVNSAFLLTATYGLLRTLAERSSRLQKLVVILCAMVVGPWTVRHLYKQSSTYRLSQEYIDAGDWLRKNAPHEQAVATPEIGYIGYESQLRVVDMYAIIHPEAVREWATNPMWWQTRKPEWLVVHRPPWLGEPAETEQENLGCEEKHRTPLPPEEGKFLAVLRCSWQRQTPATRKRSR